MASERDEVSRELQRRRALRQKREAQRRKQQRERRALLLRLSLAGVVILLVTGLIVGFSMSAGQREQNQTQPPVSAGETSLPSQTDPAGTVPQSTEQSEYTTIHIRAAGDLNVTDQMVKNALGVNGYDFTGAFLDVAGVMSQADLTVLNFEGTFGGTQYGSETGAAPAQLAQALADMGVDAVQTANSASIRSGVLGLRATIETLQNAGIQPIGTFADSDGYRDCGGYTIMQVQGLRIALVGYTKGMDNLGLPEGSADCVNLLYTDYTTDYSEIDSAGIKKLLRRVEEEQPDLTIAMVHWGSEYNEVISSSQLKIRNLLLENGVDVILGTHSHLLKTIEHDTQNNTLVAYSLGDFYGDASQAGSNYSIVLDIEVKKDNVTGVTSIAGYSYIPIYTLLPEQSNAGGQRVVRIHEAMERYENNYLGKVTTDVYESMEYVLGRIEARIAEEIK